MDALLVPEQAPAFPRVRLLGELPFLLTLWLLRSQPLGQRRPELLTYLLLSAVQLEIAWMVPRAHAAVELYLLGFSMAPYGSGCLMHG